MSTIASTSSQPFASSGEELIHPKNKDASNLSVPQEVTKTSLVDHETQLQELLSMVDESYDNLRKLEDIERKIGPQLESPNTAFPADELAALLRTLQEKVMASQLGNAKKNMETSRVEIDQNNKAKLEKIQEWIAKCEKSKKSGLWGKIFGWIGKIAALIASIAAVVALSIGSVVSGGAAAPLLALAIIGVVASVMALANQISKEAGGPEISLGNLMKTVMSKMLEALGVPEDKIENIAKTLAGVTSIMLPALLLVDQSLIGDLVAGPMGLAGADPKIISKVSMALNIAAGILITIATFAIGGGIGKLPDIPKKALEIAQYAAQITQRTAGLMSIGSRIGESVTSIVKATYDASAEKILADKEVLKALMITLQQTMEESRDQIKKVIQEIQESLQVVTKTINEVSESMAQITRNLNSNATA